MYADYEFYKNKYFGKLISEDAFNRLSEMASDKLDYLSNYRVPRYYESIVVTTEREKVLDKLIKKATCKLAEMIYDIETVSEASRLEVGYEQTPNGMRGKTIQSISAGGESITFATKTSANSVYAGVIGDSKAQNRLMYDAVREYLGGSGLLSQIL